MPVNVWKNNLGHLAVGMFLVSLGTFLTILDIKPGAQPSNIMVLKPLFLHGLKLASYSINAPFTASCLATYCSLSFGLGLMLSSLFIFQVFPSLCVETDILVVTALLTSRVLTVNTSLAHHPMDGVKQLTAHCLTRLQGSLEQAYLAQ